MLLSVLLSLLALDGDWRQECRNGLRREEHFRADMVEFIERNFRERACQNPAVESISRGTISLGPQVEIPSGASAIDFTFSSVSLRPLDEAAALSWNLRSMCGIQSWRMGEELEVSGKECDFLGLGKPIKVPSSGDKKFGVFLLHENSLFLGRLSPERDGSSSERRPLELDPVPYQRR